MSFFKNLFKKKVEFTSKDINVPKREGEKKDVILLSKVYEKKLKSMDVDKDNGVHKNKDFSYIMGETNDLTFDEVVRIEEILED